MRLQSRGDGRAGSACLPEVSVSAQNVLLVEDDPALSEFVGGLLTQAGYNPVTIADHALIGAAVDRWQPRCVILDGEIRSTGASRTWDDAAAIRRAHPTLPVVMFTADGAALAEADANTSRRSRAASFAGIVSKPFVIEEFLATVKSAVEGIAAAADAITVFPDVGQLAADWPDMDLVGMVVHELRAPLTVIRGQAQLARRQIGRDAVKERVAIDTAIAQADRMSAMLTELLDHARLSSNALTLKVIAFDLAGAVVEAIARHDYEATPRIRLRRPTGNVPVRGDSGRVAQILDNLLSNSVKYSGPANRSRSRSRSRGIRRWCASPITASAFQKVSGACCSLPSSGRRAPVTCRVPASAFTSAGGSPSVTVAVFGSRTARAPAACSC